MTDIDGAQTTRTSVAKDWEGLEAEGLIRGCRQVLLDRALGAVFSGTVVPSERPDDHRLAVEDRGYAFEVRHACKPDGAQPQRRRQRAPNDSCGVAFKDVPPDLVPALCETFNTGFRALGFEIYQTISDEDEKGQGGRYVFEDSVDNVLIRGGVSIFPAEPSHLVLVELSARTQHLMDRLGAGETC